MQAVLLLIICVRFQKKTYIFKGFLIIVKTIYIQNTYIFLNSLLIRKLYQYIQQVLCRNEKIVNYRIETCRRVLISTPLYQVGAGTFAT
jgi:hypothetical protein